MAVVSPPWPLEAGSFGAEQFRRALATLLPIEQNGIASATDWVVTQRGAGANMSVDVAEGRGVIKGTDNAYQGVYFGDTRGATNVVVTAAHATLARIDLIVARVRDTAYVAGADTFTLEVVTGTPSGSPVVPTPPSNCYILAQVAVAAAVTSIVNANITDRRIAFGSSGIMRQGPRVGCRLSRVANQSCTANTWNSFTWDTENEDNYGFVVVPNATITVPAGLGGFYTMTVQSSIPTSDSTWFRIVAAGRESRSPMNVFLTGDTYRSWSIGQTLAPGDTVTAGVYPGNTNNRTGFFEMWRVA